MESIHAFINNLEMVDNVILKTLANQNKAQYQLIKKREEFKRSLTSTSNSQLNFNYSAHSGSGQSQTSKSNQFCSKPTWIQTAKIQSSKISFQNINFKHFVNIIYREEQMSRKADWKGFKGVLLPYDVNTLEAQGRKEIKWLCSSDREERLSDPGFNKLKPATK